MSAFGEYLRSLGTPDATIAILDTPDSQRAYDKMVADSDAKVAAEKKRLEDYQVKVDEYYATTSAKAKQLENAAIVATAEAGRAKAALMEAQRQGLVDVAKDLGYTPDEPPVKTKEPPVDPNAPKYLTRDEILPAIDGAGEGLAAVFDAAAEHARLFPDKPFNARALRQAAVAAKKSFYDYWEQTYKVPEARLTAETARATAHDEAIAKKAREEERAKMASEYGTPFTRPAVASTSPFVIRKAADGKSEQPWNRSENEASDIRVRKAVENQIKREGQGVH